MHDDLVQRLVAAFRWDDPGSGSTHLVSDASGWWRDPGLLADLGPALAEPFLAEPPTVVLAPETTGILLGPLVATALGAGFVVAHKDADRLVAGATLAGTTAPDYRGRTVTLRVRARHLTTADRVLVVDDWAATGAQLRTLRDLVLRAGAGYAGAAVVVDGTDTGTRDTLGLRGLVRTADLAGG